MIDLKNRTRETKTYQYPRTVSAGSVRPQRMTVHRGRHNPKTGEIVSAAKDIAVGGVLTLPPKSTVKGLPDQLLAHPALQRDIQARGVTVRVYKTKPPKQASTAPVEPSARIKKKKSK